MTTSSRSTALAGAIVLALLAAAAPAAGQSPLTIGPVTAAPGQLASGFLEVPAAADSGTRIPISIVRGARPGPTLALIAGTHGSEVAPILGLQRLRGRVDPAAMAGTLLLVHVANLPSYLGRTIYYSPLDRKNLNRVYPGRAAGTVSERIADVITREVIARADYVVDMHAGDGNESLRPYTYWMPLGLDPRVDSLARMMAQVFGHEHIVIDSSRSRDPAASTYTSNTAMTRGIPAITTESGWLGEPDEGMVQLNVAGALRLMRWLGMIDGPLQMVRRPVWLTPTEVLRSPATGTWHALVRRGQMVPRGAALGYVTDMVLYVVATPAMNAGEPVAMVGVPSRR